MMETVSKMPLRKPLAIFAALLVGGAVFLCLRRGIDIPQNMAGLLTWFGGVTLAAYYTSSTYEATATKGGERTCGNTAEK